MMISVFNRVQNVMGKAEIMATTFFKNSLAQNLYNSDCIIAIWSRVKAVYLMGPMAHPSPKSGATFLQHGAMTVVWT